MISGSGLRQQRGRLMATWSGCCRQASPGEPCIQRLVTRELMTTWLCFQTEDSILYESGSAYSTIQKGILLETIGALSTAELIGRLIEISELQLQTKSALRLQSAWLRRLCHQNILFHRSNHKSVNVHLMNVCI